MNQSIEERNRLMTSLGFTIPTPSLCDTCDQCGFMSGGSVSFGGHTYMQRYCSQFHIGIHGSGRQACEGYHERASS